MKYLILCLVLLLASHTTSHAQTPTPPQSEREGFQRLKKDLVQDEATQKKMQEILDECKKKDSTSCTAMIEEFLKNYYPDSTPLDQKKGVTFGICLPPEKAKNKSLTVFAGKKNFECKYSVHQKVYLGSIVIKQRGFGIYKRNHPVILACFANAFGRSYGGFNVAVGLGYGISLTSAVGKTLCLAVGAGKSAGLFVGYEKLELPDFDQVHAEL